MMSDPLAGGSVFEDLIHFIQQRRGVDFRGYKRTSLQRRVRLRMEQLSADSFLEYQTYLDAHPDEFAELLNAVLINVTSFFRDQQAWVALKTEVLPKLIARGNGNNSLRFWCVGCATGEEPYSLAMLLCELLGPSEFSRRVKIYATDLDEPALDAARLASYRRRDLESVPEALLARYFEPVNDHYVVKRDLRKSVVFGRHNIVHDPPISRIDLLICRNLLIYLDTATQNLLLPRLHYALSDDGYLFLGTSEMQPARSRLFAQVDTKHRLFRKMPHMWRRTGAGGVILTTGSSGDPRGSNSDLPESIVDGSPSAYLAIDANDVVLLASAGARRMLDIGEGSVGRSFHELSIAYWSPELLGQIDRVRRQGHPLRIEHQDYRSPAAEPVKLTIDLTRLPARDGEQFAVLITLSDTTHGYALQQELEATQHRLRTTTEELQSVNEELETTNEELQSTNAELATTNQELQSANQEMEVTNEELRSANDQLVANNAALREQQRYLDAVMRILDSSVFVIDPYLKVQSWNSWSEKIWGLSEADAVGQPMLTLDIGLPLKRLEDPVRRAIAQSLPSEVKLDAVRQDGCRMKCRAKVVPLFHDDHRTGGALIVVEDLGVPD